MSTISASSLRNQDRIKASNDRWLKRKTRKPKSRKKMRFAQNYDYCSLSEISDNFK
jgi:hypothetical protein